MQRRFYANDQVTRAMIALKVPNLHVFYAPLSVMLSLITILQCEIISNKFKLDSDTVCILSFVKNRPDMYLILH